MQPGTRAEVSERMAWSTAEAMQAEFTEKAVSALLRTGLNAWRNSVGHVAVGASPA
jgi:hypothetical protein